MSALQTFNQKNGVHIIYNAERFVQDKYEKTSIYPFEGYNVHYLVRFKDQYRMVSVRTGQNDRIEMGFRESFKYYLDACVSSLGYCWDHEKSFHPRPYPAIRRALSIFQRQIETLLQGLRHVVVYFDDILVTGADDKDHISNRDKVFQRMEEKGLKLKYSKCKFMMDRVEYVGHIIDAYGLHPAPNKVEAVIKAPLPSNVKELQSFLGLVNYYRRFMPNLSLFFILCIDCRQPECAGVGKENMTMQLLKPSDFSLQHQS
ncbi:hypothetical protein MTO96_028078 [Rhipicephalus appendiculatus]